MSISLGTNHKEVKHKARTVNWQALSDVDLPPALAEIMSRNFRNPPEIVRSGMLLHDAPVDHLAFALLSEDHLCRNFDLLMRGRSEATVIDLPRTWPEGDGCPEVHWRDRKWMATVALADGLQVTLLAPRSDGDVISTYLGNAGGEELHHVALRVVAIVECLDQVKTSCRSARQITPLAIDEDYLAQVFLKFDPDHRIVELVERFASFTGSFTCKNVQTLTAGERNHAFSGSQAVSMK